MRQYCHDDRCPFCGTPLDGTVEHSTQRVLAGDQLTQRCTVVPRGTVKHLAAKVEFNR